MVATSNRSPGELYQGHFNESTFDPWVQMMADRWEVRAVSSQPAGNNAHTREWYTLGCGVHLGPAADAVGTAHKARWAEYISRRVLTKGA